MAGTLATYQGIECADVTFRRTRGFGPDVSEAVFLLSSFPDGFDFRVPQPGAVVGPIPVVEPDLEALRSGRPRARVQTGSGALAGRKSLDFAGALVLAEVDADGQEFKVVVSPLFVVAIDRVKQAEGGGPALVRVSLADERVLWAGRGFLRRWSYNRVRGDGTVAADSVKPGGAPYTLAEVAGHVVAELPRAPRLAATPEAWALRKGAVEFAPLSPAVSALGEVVRLGSVEDPVLRLDGTVALYKAGEGSIGYARDGRGDNAAELPADLLVSLEGRGQGATLEEDYPPDYVVVRGGQRITTVAMDDADPVLVLEDPLRVLPLTDETVRRLTEGRWGLEGLARFVMVPRAYQSATGIREEVAQLFREQAWRYWRVRGVVVETRAKDEQGRELPGVFDSPGPSAHMLPMLPRAETVGGRRQAVTVETYRFATEHRALRGERELDQIANARRQRQEALEEAQRSATAAGKGALGVPPPEAFDAPLTPAELLGNLRPAGVSMEDFATAVARERLAAAMDEVNPSAAARYRAALQQENAALDAINGTARAEVQEIARKALEQEKAARDLVSRFNVTQDLTETTASVLNETVEGQQIRERFSESIREALRRIKAKQDAADQRAKDAKFFGTTTRDLLEPQAVQYVRNLEERKVDQGARVVSEELGIVKVSALPGWISPNGAPAQDACTFVPKPVRIIFGTVARPRTDVAAGGASQGAAPGTGGTLTRTPPQQQTQAQGGTQAATPSGDEESWYVAAFMRLGDGAASQIPLDAVPPGEGLVIPRPDMVELVPLDGAGNKGELDKAAAGIASEQFVRPARVPVRRLTVARPWPVQCDGVVASVEIRMRPNGCGFLTAVGTGGKTAPDPNPLRSKTRPPKQRDVLDGPTREGLA